MPTKTKRKLKDLSGDGKITQKDVLIGRGVIRAKGGPARRTIRKPIPMRPRKKSPEGTLVNPKVDKLIDRALKKAALEKRSKKLSETLKNLKSKKKKSAQDPSEIKAKAGTLATKAKSTIKKVASKLTKASQAHAGQAKTLNKVVKAKKGLLAKKSTGSAIPSNPKLYAAVKAEAKRKFDVYPSAYANAWLVRTYKSRGGKYQTGGRR